jgi:hypothetical protein
MANMRGFLFRFSLLMLEYWFNDDPSALLTLTTYI